MRGCLSVNSEAARQIWFTQNSGGKLKPEPAPYAPDPTGLAELEKRQASDEKRQGARYDIGRQIEAKFHETGKTHVAFMGLYLSSMLLGPLLLETNAASAAAYAQGTVKAEELGAVAAKALQNYPRLEKALDAAATAVMAYLGAEAAATGIPIEGVGVSSKPGGPGKPGPGARTPRASGAATTPSIPTTSSAAAGEAGISPELNAAMARARAASPIHNDCSQMTKAFIDEAKHGTEVVLMPTGRGTLPTAPGVTKEGWYFHAAVELPSRVVVDPKLNAIHSSVEAWRKAIVGDSNVNLMRNGAIK